MIINILVKYTNDRIYAVKESVDGARLTILDTNLSVIKVVDHAFFDLDSYLQYCFLHDNQSDPKYEYQPPYKISQLTANDHYVAISDTAGDVTVFDSDENPVMVSCFLFCLSSFI